MKNARTWRAGILAASLLIFGVLTAYQLRQPAERTFSSDSGSYDAGAVYLLHSFTYSLDGKTATMEREPGYSGFLAVLYGFTSDHNRFVIFAGQYVLFLLALGLLLAELRHRMSERVLLIIAGFLLLFPSLFHAHLSVMRESVLASLFLLLTAALLSLERKPRRKAAFASGALLAAIILSGLPFLFLPLLLAGFFAWKRVPWRFLMPLLLIPFLCVGLWGVRNRIEFGRFALGGDFRTTAMLYVRAEQAEKVRGLEAFRCLWSEYVSRDWTGRSPACSFNGLVNTQWTGRIPKAEDPEIRSESIATILRNFPNYLWFSVFEVLEYHLPYVDGWGRRYNVAVAITQALLYTGCAIALWRWKRWGTVEWLCVLLAAYSLGTYILTDATPRYHVPLLGAYAILAATGYNALLSRFHERRLRHHPGLQ